MITIKVNKRLGREFPAGKIVRVPELNHFWRRRLKDAERDGCCEVIDIHAEAKARKLSEEAEAENKKPAASKKKSKRRTSGKDKSTDSKKQK